MDRRNLSLSAAVIVVIVFWFFAGDVETYSSIIFISL